MTHRVNVRSVLHQDWVCPLCRFAWHHESYTGLMEIQTCLMCGTEAAQDSEIEVTLKTEPATVHRFRAHLGRRDGGASLLRGGGTKEKPAPRLALPDGCGCACHHFETEEAWLKRGLECSEGCEEECPFWYPAGDQ